jgi:hypothetical protein
MVLSLSSQNVLQYLQKVGLSDLEYEANANLETLRSSQNNLNLLVTIAENHKLLVKQERCIHNEGNPYELYNEWLFHQLLEHFPVLRNISAIASLVAHFDEENGILVRNYLTEFTDLASFYQNNQDFPEAIATAIGTNLGELHRATFNRREYRNFMATTPQGGLRYHFYNPAQGIEPLNPEIFGTIPMNGLKFYTLYQSYESLEAAIAELASLWFPCCLTHNYLNLENILVHSRWEQLDNCLVRLIDWKACAWGDPLFDLGTLVASYLNIWLESLVVDPTIELEESLQLAITTLEDIQPSILALTQAYLNAFPLILHYNCDFVLRIIQFAGLALIHQIQEKINRSKFFDNAGVCKLQVAKTLLTKPLESVLTIFGVTESEIIQPFSKFSQPQQTERKQNLLRLYYDKTRLRGC